MVVKNKSLLTVSALALIAALITFNFVTAQQVATDVIDDVQIEQTGFNAVVKILFRQPVRYISHSPASKGKTINVQMRLITNSFSGRFARLENESVRPRVDIGLNEVVFEKNQTGAEAILLYFDEAVSFEVISGNDQRSLSIVIYGLK